MDQLVKLIFGMQILPVQYDFFDSKMLILQSVYFVTHIFHSGYVL